jgi:DNA processing protein
MVSGSDHSDLSALVALSLLPPWTWRGAAAQLRAGAAARTILDDLLARRATSPSNGSIRQRADAAIARAVERAIVPVPWSDAAYPAALATIIDPPFVLWTRGCLAALARPAVALVGSRAASPHGLAVAERLAVDLAARGVVVVSGLARGVDSAAHRGTLAGGGCTVAVLGSGVDRIYPPEHAALAGEIERAGTIVSELVPGTPPLPLFFPMRNRIISGLVRAVVVIEAGVKSGSLITARLALDQGREVLAVPGNVLSGRNRGGHALLRDGAKIVEDADDILDELGIAPAGNRAAVPASIDPVLASLAPGEPADLDAIVERTGVPAPRLLTRLLDLELRGFVARAGGGRFVRIDRSC